MVVLVQSQGGGGYSSCSLELLFAVLLVHVSVCGPLHRYAYAFVSAESGGPGRSGYVCSLSTMKSFLKPMNNVKGKHREPDPPIWSHSLHPPRRLGPLCSCFLDFSSLGKHQSQAPEGLRQLNSWGPTQAVAACSSVCFP